jgi:nucleoside-diphosphate-sugar epimerase
MHAFLTGGSGFVGRNLIASLKARGDTVSALARSDAAIKTVQQLGAEPVLGDLENVEALRSGMTGCGVVFHSAAKVEDWGRYEDFYRANVNGTENVLQAARASGVKKIVHVSTEAVLAGGPPICNADETWPRAKNPLGLYPLTKGLAEECVLAANSSELATVIVRPRFIWGKGDASLLPQIIQAVQRREFMWINGGRYLTSTCHVKNVCEGTLLAAEHGRGGEIYFLTDGPPIEFRYFITALLKTQNIDPGNRNVPLWLARNFARIAETIWRVLRLNSRPPITRTAVCLIGESVTVNDTKARRELGYAGKVSMAEGLAEMM